MKRVSDRQLSRDDPSDDEGDSRHDENDDASGMREGFERAPPEVMAQRRVIRVRRTMPAASVPVPKGNHYGAGPSDEGEDAAEATTAPDAVKNPFAAAFTQIRPRAPSADKPPDATPSSKSESDRAPLHSSQDQPAPGAAGAANTSGIKVHEAEDARAEKDRQTKETIKLGDVATKPVQGTAVEKAISATPVSTTDVAARPTAYVVGTGPDGTTNDEGKALGMISEKKASDVDLGTTPGREENAKAEQKDKDSGAEGGQSSATEQGVPTSNKVPIGTADTSGALSTANEGNGAANGGQESLTLPTSNGATGASAGQTSATGEGSRTLPSASGAGVTTAFKPKRPVSFSFGGMGARVTGATFGNAATDGSSGFFFANTVAFPSQSAVTSTGATGTGASAGDKVLGAQYQSHSLGSSTRDHASGSVKLSETEVVTGEEDEAEIFRARCRLYVLEEGGSKWLERGVGYMKVNRHKETNNSRLLMRTEATLRVILNTPVYEVFKLDRATDRSVRFQGICVDSDDPKRHTAYLARFNAKDDLDRLVKCIESCNNVGSS